MPNQLTFLEIMGSVGPLVIGALAIIGSFVTVLVQSWQNKSLEETRARYQYRSFVHQKRFEQEFSVYVELWGAVYELGRTVRRMPKEVDTTDRAKYPENECQERFAEAYESMQEVVFKYRPFYAINVYHAARAILDEASELSKAYKRKSRSGDYLERAGEHIGKISILIDPACEAIRQTWSEVN